MNALTDFLKIITDNRSGKAAGIYSICSAHPDVIRAAMLQAGEDNSIVLIESTSNQVDQFGGYTGMKPSDFVKFTNNIADRTGFPRNRILLGGDHLGPNAWRDLPASEAMSHGENLVRAYVKAGYLKIHLDASMFCADDTGNRHLPLGNKIVASRTARLCKAAEDTWKEMDGSTPKPVYIIGTEVPIPGGATEEESAVVPTLVEDAEQTLEITRRIFKSSGLEDAWERVIGLVVQPGVEFGDDQVFLYDRKAASKLSGLITDKKRIVFEAHSTDYQSESCLKNMVEDHFCILKVGPWLTFAYREALFALEQIEKEILKGQQKEPSDIGEILDSVMKEKPSYWQKYYKGNQVQLAFKRKFSFSDRSRYYWPDMKLSEAVSKLKLNLDNCGIPISILSQYMPNQFDALMEGRISSTADNLIIDRIRDVIRKYSKACGLLNEKANQY